MKNVVIIGAGPAGITAGLELKRKHKDEFDITILEVSDRIGGISATVEHNGNFMDLGGHRFFSKDESVNKWWDSILSVNANPQETDKVMLTRHRVSRIFYKNKFFDYPVSLKPQTIKNLGFKKTVKSGFSYLASAVHKRDEGSLENFYINRFGKELYSTFFEDYTEKLWGRHPSVISADWGAQRVKGISISEVLKNALTPNKSDETSLIEKFKYPKFGPGQLWTCAAEEFENLGGKIIFNAEVDKINLNGNKVKSVVADGKEYNADIFISTMPIKDLISGMGDSVNEEIKKIANGLPYRDFVTLGLLVNKLKIKNETDIKTISNIVPDCWIYVQDKGVKLGRIQIFNNWSPYLVKDIKNTVWIGLEYFCNEGDSFWNLSEEELKSQGVNELVKIGVLDSDAKILDFHREKVKKAYPAYFDTYGDLDKVIEYLNSLENLYCIGRNGQHRYNNMDHSMLTAFRAIDCIINDNNDKSEIWKVNTEKEYHEEKSK